MPLEQSAPKKTFFPQSSGRISAWSMVSAFRLRLGAGCGCGRTVAGLVGTGDASRFRLASAASRLPRSTRPRFLRESRLPVLNGLLARHTVSLPSHIRASKCCETALFLQRAPCSRSPREPERPRTRSEAAQLPELAPLGWPRGQTGPEPPFPGAEFIDCTRRSPSC